MNGETLSFIIMDRIQAGKILFPKIYFFSLSDAEKFAESYGTTIFEI